MQVTNQSINTFLTILLRTLISDDMFALGGGKVYSKQISESIPELFFKL